MDNMVTIYRDGCMREGILTIDEPKGAKEDKETCPECGGEMRFTEGCNMCVDCGFGACSI